MDLSRIFTIAGKPGLQQMIAQSKNGVIVESLVDKKRFNASATSKISSLEDISIFCIDGDIPLKEVFEKIAVKNSYDKVDMPTNDQLKPTLITYLETLDEERVYDSDVKKIFKWYNLLIGSKIIVEEKKEVKKEAPKKEAAAKKAPAKKKAAAKK